MATSYNGWPVNRTPALDNSPIPGTNIKFAPGILAGDVAEVLLFVGTYVHYKIEAAITPGCWGFSYRENRNSNNWSCHASATAIDFSAPRHPNGVRGTWSAAERAAIHWLINVYLEGVVQWGEDYTGTVDGMHFEIIKGAADVARVAAKIRRDYGDRANWPAVLTGQAASVPTPPTSVPTPPTSVFTPAPVASKWHKTAMGEPTDLWASGEQVARDQADLIDSGFTVGSSGADGFAGDDTVAAIRAAQAALGISVDGVMGANTRNGIHRIPSYGLPAGHVYGPITGPADVHGGINPAERAKVKALQGQLIRKGFVGAQRDPARTTWDDGRFEAATTTAVKKFQSAERLAADGLVGPMTWTRLFR